MVDFCPECGGLLRKNRCKCGYGQKKPRVVKSPQGSIVREWNPPSPNVIYCKATATPIEKLKIELNKGTTPEKLKDIRNKLKKRELTCMNCVYYEEKELHCQIKNKYYSKDSICTMFEPFGI
ncbi:MAG: hypothetical protein JW891_05705 [Candidatus Lokiarchaeota archaeon]|nr:hypothetical protein [Candidatus Lokiarchaeota archaeon]